MSAQAVSDCVYRTRARGAAYRVLLAMAFSSIDAAPPYTLQERSLGYIAERAHLSRITTIRALACLEADGLIQRLGSKGRRNRYHILPDLTESSINGETGINGETSINGETRTSINGETRTSINGETTLVYGRSVLESGGDLHPYAAQDAPEEADGDNAPGGVPDTARPLGHIWREVRARLAGQLSAAQLASWVAPARLYQARDAPPGRYVLVATGSHQAELLGGQLLGLIETTVAAVTGGPCSLVVTVAGMAARGGHSHALRETPQANAR